MFRAKLKKNTNSVGRIIYTNVGTPPPARASEPKKYMPMAIHGANNKAMTEALTEVQGELIRGEGLSKPMGKRSLFLPLMVQMARVGEETGNCLKEAVTLFFGTFLWSRFYLQLLPYLGDDTGDISCPCP